MDDHILNYSGQELSDRDISRIKHEILKTPVFQKLLLDDNNFTTYGIKNLF